MAKPHETPTFVFLRTDGRPGWASPKEVAAYELGYRRGHQKGYELGYQKGCDNTQRMNNAERYAEYLERD